MKIRKEEISKKFGEKILELRQSLKLTQDEFAKKIGTTQKNVSRWESGTSLVSPLFIFQISKIVGVPISYWDEENKSKFYSDFDKIVFLEKEVENLRQRLELIEKK